MVNSKDVYFSMLGIVIVVVVALVVWWTPWVFIAICALVFVVLLGILIGALVQSFWEDWRNG